MKKRIISLVLALVMCVGLAVPAFADVEPDIIVSVPPEGLNDPNWVYQYEPIEYGYRKLVGAFYQGAYYTYLYDDADVIEGMLDADGNQIVKYEYDQHGLVVCTYSNENSVWVKNEDSNFIGNKNKMLYTGMYFDEATNCYYVNDRYFNPVLNKYMDGVDDNSVFVDSNPYLYSEDGIMPLDDSALVDKIVTEWADDLLANDSYGDHIQVYTPNWYSSLSDVEVLARAIYCEGGVKYTQEENAVATVILNRVYDVSFPNTPIDVVKQTPSQFASITGNASTTDGARNPDKYSDRWRHSTYLACLLLTTTDRNHWNKLAGSSITNQVRFYAYSLAQNVFYDSGSKLMYHDNYETFETAQVYVLGYGVVNSFQTLFTTYSPIQSSRNIYYNKKA